MRLDTQMFLIVIVLIFATCAMFYLNVALVAWTFFAFSIALLGFYVWHIRFLQKNSIKEMELKQYEIEKYWELTTQNPDILAERERRVGFNV